MKESRGVYPSIDVDDIRDSCEWKTFERAYEYVSSAELRKRIVWENLLGAEIVGNYGIYQVSIEVEKDNLNAQCTCPAEMDFCKHAVALGLTWIEDPESFFNINQLMDGLRGNSKDYLLDMIVQIVTTYPYTLSVFGIEGFEEEEDWDEEWDDWGGDDEDD